jgi:hypothetical protein
VVAEITQITELRQAYRLTYAEYARRADLLGRLKNAAQPDPAALELAALALERARLAHTEARNRLAAELLDRPRASAASV